MTVEEFYRWLEWMRRTPNPRPTDWPPLTLEDSA